MNKASFRWAFLALLASSLTGCASPMKLFAKKPQSYEEYKAEQIAKQTQIAGSRTVPANGQVEITELLNKGHAAFQQGNLPEAQSQYFAIVQRQPNHPVANHRLGVIADRQQDYQSAQRYYFAALQASPRDPNLLNDVGYSFLLQSRYAEAEQYLQSALRLNGSQSNAINNLGLLYAKQGQADRALAMFRRTNSEAEAQAKLARLLPSSAGAGTMFAQNPSAPQNTMNPAPIWNSGPTGEVAATPTGSNLPNGYPPNFSPGAWPQHNPTIPNNASAITQAAANLPAPAINDPNIPEATRILKEQMEREKRRAVAERQARDLQERQRRETAARQLREEEFGRANAGNPNFPQPSDPNRLNLPPYGHPNAATWSNPPNSSAQPHGNGYVDLIPSSVPNIPSTPLPNTTRGQMPQSGPGSPLDTMPAWPSGDSVPMNAPNSLPSGSASWPSVVPSGGIEDPARAAARLGMSGGPGNMFPITPGTSSAPTNSTNWPPASNRTNQFAPPNGLSPTTPHNWPANSAQPSNAPTPGEPPAGTFGPGNFNTSANSQSQLPMTPAQYALREQLPQSDLYQTPTRFGFASSGNNTAQPTGFASNQGPNGTLASQFPSTNLSTLNPAQQQNAMQRNNTRIATPDRFGGTQWEQGQPQGTQSPQMSSPTIQGFLPTTLGDNSLLEYERDIQRQNAEVNQIRQEIDAQRQLPGSENYSTYGRK